MLSWRRGKCGKNGMSAASRRGPRVVIDFHSHVLPKMDDGSKSVEMTLEMLRTERGMGVDIVAATPHFYGYRESLDSFLARREHAWGRLLEAGSSVPRGELPAVVAGAEVAFFSGLTEMDGLDALCINGTKTLLLEMPFAPWTGYELNAVSSLCLDRGYHVVLAHLERFYELQTDEHLMEELLALPLWVQINAETVLPLLHRKRWIEMFRAGEAHLLGSDCHNMTRRPPNLGAARAILARKAGQDVLTRIDELGARLLGLDAPGGAS